MATMADGNAQVLENPGAGDIISTSTPKVSDSTTTLKRSDPRVQNALALQLGNDSFTPWDSTFIMVHRYNKAIAGAKPFTDLSTTASPQKLLLFDGFAKPGFLVGLNPYPIQNKTPDSFLFYKAKVALTRFRYTQGPDGVFILDAQHTQNFSPTWNVSVDFSSIQNAEMYQASAQNHLHRATSAGSNFRSKNGSYENMVVFVWNRARRIENRGLLNDSIFFVSDTDNIRTIGNYLPASTSAKSFYANSHHVLDHKFYPGKQRSFYLLHHTDFIKDKYEYQETRKRNSYTDSVFYGNDYVFYDSAFHDSTLWVQWNNQLGVGGKSKFKNSAFYWRGWYGMDRIAYNSIYKTSANIYLNQSLHALVSGNTNGSLALQWAASGHYYVAGYNSGNYLVHAQVKYLHKKNAAIEFAAKSQQYRAPFFSERFPGNFLRYFNDRSAIRANSFSAGANWSNKFVWLRGKFTAGTVTNALYADTLSRFQQVNSLSYAQFEGTLHLRAGKFHLDNRFTLQQHSQAQLIPYPVFSNLLGLYFEGRIFKKAMLARMGADMWYQTAYNGYHYQPMNGTFYAGKTSVGNYPWVDLYFSGEVKTVMLFIKLEHCNNYLNNYGFNNQYVSAISYPSDPIRLRFGFVWRFYN